MPALLRTFAVGFPGFFSASCFAGSGFLGICAGASRLGFAFIFAGMAGFCIVAATASGVFSGRVGGIDFAILATAAGGAFSAGLGTVGFRFTMGEAGGVDVSRGQEDAGSLLCMFRSCAPVVLLSTCEPADRENRPGAPGVCCERSVAPPILAKRIFLCCSCFMRALSSCAVFFTLGSHQM